jgi:hypothetical protein
LKPKVILGLKGPAFFLFLKIPPLFAKAGTALRIGVSKVSINFMFSILLHRLLRFSSAKSLQKTALIPYLRGFWTKNPLYQDGQRLLVIKQL